MQFHQTFIVHENKQTLRVSALYDIQIAAVIVDDTTAVRGLLLILPRMSLTLTHRPN